jgi:hypothetical protein
MVLIGKHSSCKDRDKETSCQYDSITVTWNNDRRASHNADVKYGHHYDGYGVPHIGDVGGTQNFVTYFGNEGIKSFCK